MRSRKWIGIVALLGLLLHAGAVVRHNAAMTGATLQYHALLTGLGQICHGGAGPAVLDAAELPYVPRPTDAQNGCPLCSGLCSDMALPAPEPLSTLIAPSGLGAFHATGDWSGASAYAVCPPARGPPSVA